VSLNWDLVWLFHVSTDLPIYPKLKQVDSKIHRKWIGHAEEWARKWCTL